MDDKKFLKYFEKKVQDTVRRYRLFSKKDKIAVAVSGGKDSTAALFVLKKLGYDVKAVTIDVSIGNYTKKNLENIRDFCAGLGVELVEFSFKKEFGYSLCYLRSAINSKGHKLKSCTVCGVLRRYMLNKYSRKLGVDVVVTGHNLDDEAQAFMMNVFRNTLQMSARLGPRSGVVKDKLFVPRVKPLYFCSEKEVVRYSKLNDFKVMYGKCPCSSEAYRNTVKEILERESDEVKLNIVNNFLSQMGMLQKIHPKGDINVCSNCGEPSKHKLCQACSIVNLLR